jgi:hypothetical protein
MELDFWNTGTKILVYSRHECITMHERSSENTYCYKTINLAWLTQTLKLQQLLSILSKVDCISAVVTSAEMNREVVIAH